MRRHTELKRRPYDGGDQQSDQQPPTHHSQHHQKAVAKPLVAKDSCSTGLNCSSITECCSVKSDFGKLIADIACAILILMMTAGVVFSCYSLATVYMSLGSNSAGQRPSAAAQRHEFQREQRRHEAADDETGGYQHPAARRLRNRDQLMPPDPQIPLPASAAKLHVFRLAAVSSDSEVCSEIGKNFLLPQNGGNAIDATLATLFCNGLVTMQSMGLGGGFVANIYIAREQRAYSLNARERAPASVATTDPTPGDVNSTPRNYGPSTILVPGEPLGYWSLHRRFAQLSWAQLWAPTIALCRRGFVMTRHMADFLRPTFRDDPHLRHMFIDPATEQFRAAGQLIRPPSVLCDFYALLAERGARDFYNGTAAGMLLDDLHELGASGIGAADLSGFRVQWSDSRTVPLGEDGRLHVTPAPSSGPLVAMMMRVLQGYEWRDGEVEEREVLGFHRVAETFKWAFAKRMEMGDPGFVAGMAELTDNITSEAFANYVRQKIDAGATRHTPADYDAHSTDDEMNRHGTAHVSVIGPNGDAVSVTSSINYYFGCGRTGPRTGLLLNTGLDDFSGHDGQQTNYFGLPRSAANRPAPGKRAMSSMAPVIVSDRRTGQVLLVAGASGGTKIPTALATVLMRTLCWRQSLKQAVDAPRVHHQLVPMRLEYEYGLTEQLVAELRLRGHRMLRYGDRGSIVSALARNESGVFGVADYRKRGEVVGF